MRILNLFLITLTCLTSLLGAQGESDEDDCEFIKSLPAKSDAKTLDFTVKDNTYPRDYCAYWRLVGSRSKVIRIDVAAIKQAAPGICRNAYLKLDDDGTEVIAKVNSRFLFNGPQVSIIFRPDRCLQNFRLAYRSSANHEETDGASSGLHDNDDDDDDKDSSSMGTIVGAVIGCVLAVVLIVLICVLVFKCVRRRKARQATPGDDISVHFWSKPSGYTQGTTVGPSTSRDASHEYDSLSFPASHKLGPAEAGVYHNSGGLASNLAMAPGPPPYTGHPTNSVTESSHFSKELPPSYSDVVQSK